jgi:hypothetical protein
MLILSADPGPSRCGFAVVRVEDGRFTIVEAIWRPFAMASAPDRDWWKARVREALASGGIVAVEQVLHAYGDTPDGALIDTKDVESALVTLAYEAGGDEAHVTRISAVSWRKDLGIMPPATDAQVAIAVAWIYTARALEDIDGDARSHAHDALGLAAVAVARKLARRFTMPPDVRSRIFAAHAEAKNANAARKAAKKMAEPVRAALEKAGPVATTVATLAATCGMLPPAVVEALNVLSRARGPQAVAARNALVASGYRKPEKAPATKQATARRRGAAGRGWRGRRRP